MDRTLFTPPMIETFRVCKRAYLLASAQTADTLESTRSSAVCKKFLLKALGEINRGRITAVHQVQKFLGQNWPVERIRPTDCVKAFLFTYKTLISYVAKPYRPDGSRVVGVNLKARARIPNDRVYLEDTFDLILWHPAQRRLEFVDFHLHPLKAFDEAWPSASILVKQFLAERLRARWPFERLSLTFCRVGPQGFVPTTLHLDERLYKAHWPELLQTIEAMKEAEHELPEGMPTCLCRRCAVISQGVPSVREGDSLPVSRTA